MKLCVVFLSTVAVVCGGPINGEKNFDETFSSILETLFSFSPVNIAQVDNITLESYYNDVVEKYLNTADLATTNLVFGGLLQAVTTANDLAAKEFQTEDVHHRVARSAVLADEPTSFLPEQLIETLKPISGIFPIGIMSHFLAFKIANKLHKSEIMNETEILTVASRLTPFIMGVLYGPTYTTVKTAIENDRPKHSADNKNIDVELILNSMLEVVPGRQPKQDHLAKSAANKFFVAENVAIHEVKAALDFVSPVFMLDAPLLIAENLEHAVEQVAEMLQTVEQEHKDQIKLALKFLSAISPVYTLRYLEAELNEIATNKTAVAQTVNYLDKTATLMASPVFISSTPTMEIFRSLADVYLYFRRS